MHKDCQQPAQPVHARKGANVSVSRYRLLLKPMLLTLVLALCASAMQADMVPGSAPAITVLEFTDPTPGPEGVIPIFADSDATLGWKFVVNSPVQVSALGFFDSGMDGLREPHLVGIWNENEQLIASAEIGDAETNSLLGSYRYASIDTLSLIPGNTYVIGATVPLGVFMYPNENTMPADSYPFYNVGPGNLVLDSRIAIVSESQRFDDGILSQGSEGPGTLHFPGEPVQGGYFFGANLLLVPEPGTIGLLAVGAFGLFRNASI